MVDSQDFQVEKLSFELLGFKTIKKKQLQEGWRMRFGKISKIRLRAEVSRKEWCTGLLGAS
jgi:hypothetical protein